MKPRTWACTKCHRRKDFVKKFFCVARHNKHGLSLCCRDCINKARRKKH